MKKSVKPVQDEKMYLYEWYGCVAAGLLIGASLDDPVFGVAMFGDTIIALNSCFS